MFNFILKHLKPVRNGKLFFSGMLFYLLLGFAICSTPTAEAQSTKSLYNSALKGDTEAMRKLGLRLIKGIAVKARDIPNGAKWLKKASDLGDPAASYQVGRLYEEGLYYGKSTSKAIKYYKLAAEGGEEKAIKRLAKLAPDWTPSSNIDTYTNTQVSDSDSDFTPDDFTNPEFSSTHEKKKTTQPARTASASSSEISGSDEVVQEMAIQIASTAVNKNARRIAVVSFQSNGGQCDKLTRHIRSLMLDEFTNTDDENAPEFYDREDSKAVATESGFSMEGEQLSGSHAILVGEVFSAPGDSIGYISYRLFRATDTTILDAGFRAVKWNKSERSAINGSTSTPQNNSLPYIEDSEMKKFVAGLTRLSNTGIAMGQSGAQSAENTLNKRMAYAQLIPAMLKSGVRLFEREFFLLAARETALSNQEAMPGHAKAIGQLKDTLSSSGSHKYKLQVSAIPSGKLLLTRNITQNSNGSAVQQGHNGENDLNALIEEIEAENRNVQLVYEYEVIISDEYVAPEKFYGSGSICLMCGDRDYAKDNKVAARTRLKQLAADLVRKHINNKKEIAKSLALFAISGFAGDKGYYFGPLVLCLEDAYSNLQVSRNGYINDLPNFAWHPSFREKWLQSPTQGSYTDNDVSLKYATSIEWKDGLPWKVKARVDFTPSKSILIKRK